MKTQRVLKVLSTLRDVVADDLSVQKAQVLMAIAGSPRGIALGDVQRMAGLTKSAASRNVLDLSDLTSRRKPGPGLVEMRPDPNNRAYKLVYLTPVGHDAVNKILKALGEHEVEVT